jgi:hypothetical protein
MRKWFWVSRNDSDSPDINIHIRARKPQRDKHYPDCWDFWYGFHPEGDTDMCRKYFEKFTGIKLKPGECKKVQLTAKIL